MEIQDILEEIFSSKIIRKRYFDLKKQNSLDYYEKNFLSGIVNYCVILNTKEDVELFASIDNETDKLEFFKEKIAQHLKIKNESNNEREIFKYACDKLYIDGFVYHVTNSVDAEEIMKNGFNSNKIPLKKELKDIGEILKKYNASSLIGWSSFDKDLEKGWFYSGTIGDSEHYSNSPEWLSQLCGESILYSKDDEKKVNAYLNRDYDQAKENIEHIINSINMNNEDKSKVLEFFNMAWKRYEKATPKAIMIPRKSINKTHCDVSEYYKPQRFFKELLTNKGIFKEFNENTDKNINQNELISFDLSNMFLSENRRKEKKNEKVLKDEIKKVKQQETIINSLTFEEMLELEIKKVISNIDVKKYVGMSYSEQNNIDNQIKDIWRYLSILKSNEGLDEYMEVDNKQDFLEKKIAKKIGVTNVESNVDSIMEYAYQNLVEGGYVIHATNSKRADGILNGNNEGEYIEKKDIVSIYNIMSKYIENPSLFGFYFRQEPGTWYYTCNPSSVIRYATRGPEWFDYFCGGSREYSNICKSDGVKLSKLDRSAYQYKDKELAKSNVKLLLEHYKFSVEDSEKINEFFEKVWKINEKSNPTVLLVPIKEVMENREYIHDSFVSQRDFRYLEIFTDEISDRVIDSKTALKVDIPIDIDREKNIIYMKDNEKDENQVNTSQNNKRKYLSVEDCIAETLNINYIKELCLRFYETSSSLEKRQQKVLSQIINYCVLFKTNDGIIEYIKTPDDKKKNFIINKIKFELEKNKKDSNPNNINDFIKENFYQNGYVYHGTNSKSAENILKNGLQYNFNDFENSDIKRIMEISRKYRCVKLLGWLEIDQENKKGWFYDETPENLYSYAAGPEWFKQFCGETIDYASIVENRKRSAFKFRDYEQALKNVQSLIESKKMSEDERNEILDFFEKNWEKYGNTYPTMLMIPRKKIVKNTINWSVDDMLKEVIFSSHGEINCSSYENVNPEDIKMVDLSNIFYRYNHKKNESSKETCRIEQYKLQGNDLDKISFNDCMQIIRGFDIQRTQHAKKLMEIMQKRKKQSEETSMEDYEK